MFKKTIAVAMTAMLCATGGVITANSDTASFVNPICASAAESNQDFINSIGNAAVSYYQQYRILPSMTVAQAILESGWGNSSLAQYHNYFGMKARDGYTGKKKLFNTKEEVNGRMIDTQAYFRIYDTRSLGIKGYYEFINIDRYSNLKNETDYKASCRKIQQDGWATASTYAEKLISLIEQYDLTKFDKQAGVGTGTVTSCNYLISLNAGTAIYTSPTSGISNSKVTVSTKYTIIEEYNNAGQVYGKLKSGAGWVKVRTEVKPIKKDVNYTKSFPKGTVLYTDAGSGKVSQTLTAAGTFTIVEEKTVNGITYGKFKSGAGWAVL